MRTIAQVIKRQFSPQLEMVREAVVACPVGVFVSREVGPREYSCHALVGRGIRLTEDRSVFRFDEIVDE